MKEQGQVRFFLLLFHQLIILVRIFSFLLDVGWTQGYLQDARPTGSTKFSLERNTGYLPIHPPHVAISSITTTTK